MTTTEGTIRNRDYVLQIMNENLAYANEHLQNYAEDQGLTWEPYTLKEYIETESENDPNFFRWLFNSNFDSDFDSDLTQEQREEYEEFVNSL